LPPHDVDTILVEVVSLELINVQGLSNEDRGSDKVTVRLCNAEYETREWS
jgi:hypothetical protein